MNRFTLRLTLVAGVALAAYLGVSASAFGAFDPLCGPNGSRAKGVYGQSIKTDVRTPYTEANTWGEGVACPGRNYGGAADDALLFTRLRVPQPPGAYVGGVTNASNNNRFVGRACVGVLGRTIIGTPIYVGRSGGLGQGNCPAANQVIIRVDNRTSGNDCPTNPRPVDCFLGTSDAGTGSIWVTRGRFGYGYTVIIGPFRVNPVLLVRAGLTRIEALNGTVAQRLNPPFQCAKLGSTTGTTCGSGGDPVVFRSGDPIPADEEGPCLSPGGSTSNGTGTYKLVATNGEGPTDPVTTCSPWLGSYQPPPTPAPAPANGPPITSRPYPIGP